MILCVTEKHVPGKQTEFVYCLGQEQVPESWRRVRICEDVRMPEVERNALIRKREREGCLEISNQIYRLSELTALDKGVEVINLSLRQPNTAYGEQVATDYQRLM